MSDATKRKQAEREKDKAEGMVRVSMKLTSEHGARLNELCELTEYDKAELVALLVHRHWQKVKAIVETLGDCEYCGNALPQGCGGKWKGHKECFKTIKQRELLSL
jgi:hypothetical protein